MSFWAMAMVAEMKAVVTPMYAITMQGIGGEHREDARHQIHAGCNHGRGMDQGADRCRAFHGIREPHMERELGGFADGTAEDQDTRGGQPSFTAQGQLFRTGSLRRSLSDRRYGTS